MPEFAQDSSNFLFAEKVRSKSSSEANLFFVTKDLGKVRKLRDVGLWVRVEYEKI